MLPRFYIPIPSADGTGLSWTELSVLSYIRFRQQADDHRLCRDSFTDIKKYFGLSDKTLRRTVNDLENMGLIEKTGKTSALCMRLTESGLKVYDGAMPAKRPSQHEDHHDHDQSKKEPHIKLKTPKPKIDLD